MSVRRVAAFSVHTSPLAQPGRGDGGGMNVYVDSLASSLARAGIHCDVFVRKDSPAIPDVVEVEPGYRVVHLEAGPMAPVGREELVRLVDPMVDRAAVLMAGEGYDVLHAHYWSSGAVAHQLKHRLSLPLVTTFHTLGAVKAAAGLGDDVAARTRIEGEIVRCSDLISVSTATEVGELVDFYGADAQRIEVVPPGVDHRVFHPGSRDGERTRLGLGRGPVVLFAGRIQPLKGADLAVAAVAALDDPSVTLLVVGDPSGPSGRAEAQRLRALALSLGIGEQVEFLPAVPHEKLARYYRAADVCIVPSHSESFGLVALEAAACGTPVVASAVGGLTSLVDHGQTGLLVAGRDPTRWADALATVLFGGVRADEMRARAQARSGRYSWSITAGRLRRLYSDLVASELVTCR